VHSTEDTPIFIALLEETGERRRAAEDQAASARAQLADVEALHEPDRQGNCPTCQAEAPCPTLRLVRGEIDLESAYGLVRGQIDLTGEPATTPHIPRLSDLLAGSTASVDRFFESLLGPERN
jgi:hypothetical protein